MIEAYPGSPNAQGVAAEAFPGQARQGFLPKCPGCGKCDKVTDLHNGVSGEVNGALQEADQYACARCIREFWW